MYEINNQTKINAPVAHVWQVLTDFDHYHAWNPVIRRVDGPLTVGQSVTMTASSPAGDQQWSCRVSRYEPGRGFAWRFTDRSPLLYRGEHTFWLVPIDARSTRYLDRETFSGLLVSRRQHHLATITKAGMIAMGEALKHRAEADVGSGP